MTKFRSDRFKSYSIHSIQPFSEVQPQRGYLTPRGRTKQTSFSAPSNLLGKALIMGDRRLSSKALDLWLLAVCSCLLTLLCHSLTHPSSLPSSLNSTTSTSTATAASNLPAPAGGQRAPQFFIPSKSSAPDQEIKSDADE